MLCLLCCSGGTAATDRAVVTAATEDAALHGNPFAHHLRGDIYEVRARTAEQQLRILYATEGRSDQVLLALHVISKKSRTGPDRDISTVARIAAVLGKRLEWTLVDAPDPT